MTASAAFNKHPLETLSYQFSFADFMAASSDSIASWFVEADVGVQITDSALSDDSVITVEVAGGTQGARYRIAAQVDTAEGLSERIEYLIRIRGSQVTGDRIPGGGVSAPYVQNGYLLSGYYVGDES